MASTPRFDAALDSATLCAAFQRTVEAAGERLALRTRGGASELTWREYGERVRRCATGLTALGVGHGDTVALLLSNRPEFHIVDAAAMHIGAVTCSVYNTAADEQIAYVLRDSGASALVTEGERGLAAARDAGVRQLVVIDDPTPGAVSLGELEQAGDASLFDAAWRAVQPDDLLALIYTSGTTGPPKGVELTHRAALTAGRAFLSVIALPEGSRVVSYLPMAHVAERCCSHWLAMVLGFTVTCCPDPREVIGFLPDVRPTWFFSVPRVWEKLGAAVEVLVDTSPPERRQSLREAIDLGVRASRARRAGRPEAAADERARLALDAEVLAPLRAQLGLGGIEIAAVGAAPTPIEVLELFAALGVELLEIWGMSELCAATCVNPPGRARLGTVGLPLPGSELRLADDGELLVRTAAMMRGYRNRPQATRETVDGDGWLHTGDIARIDDDGYVTIVDRKKELIINAAGKNMSPAEIEAAIRPASAIVSTVCCIGDARPYNVALITLDPDIAVWFAGQRGAGGTEVPALACDPAILAEVARAVELGNRRLARVEQVKRFLVLDHVWPPCGDLLTPTMKLRRKQIAVRYAREIEGLYA